MKSVVQKKEVLLDYGTYQGELAESKTQGYDKATQCLIKILRDIQLGNTTDAFLNIEEHFEPYKTELLQLLKITP